MSPPPLTDVHYYYVQNGVLHRRGATDQQSPIFTPGQIRPDTPGADSMAGLDGVSGGRPTLTALTAGDVTMFDTGYQFTSGSASGTAVPGQTGTGAANSRYTLKNVKIDGRLIDKSVKYGELIASEVVPSARATSDTGLVSTNNTTVPNAPDMFKITQCDLHCTLADAKTNGIMGHGWSSYRNHIWNVVDGLHCYPQLGSVDNYVSTIGDWIEFQNWIAGSLTSGGTNTDHTDGSHSDCWQIEGGGHNYAEGTYFNSEFRNTNVGGVTPYLRLNSTDNTAAGNAHQYYGTLAGTNVIQITQLAAVTQGGITYPRRPVNYLSLINCWFDGGYSQMVNFSANGSGGYVDGSDYLNCVIKGCRFGGRRFGATSGYWVSGDPAGPSKTLVINTPTGSTLPNLIDFGNGAGSGVAGTNLYMAMGDALDNTHVPVFRNSNTVYRLA